jgi:formyltetrahydrofolate deformylase
MFFQRIRFDWADLRTDRTSLEAANAEAAERFEMTWRLAVAERPKRMAIFVSKFDHCLYDLLLRHQAGELRCEIPLIVSNHADHRGIAKQFGIAFQATAFSTALPPRATPPGPT